MSSKRLRKRVARLAREAKTSEALNHARAPPTELQNLWHQFKIRTERFNIWITGQPLQHFGPRCRLIELFTRRDETYLALAESRLRWHLPAPRHHHNILDAATNVVRVEDSIGYKFRNKMLCIEALKMSGIEAPLYCEGTIHPLYNNKRLALLGDRTLSMVVCDLWYRSGNHPRDYSAMEQDVITRANLALRGREIGIQEAILGHAGMLHAKPNMIAETFEAILGAVYLDSDSSLDCVAEVVHYIGLDEHPALQRSGLVPKDTEVSDARIGADGSVRQYEPRQSSFEAGREQWVESHARTAAPGA